MRPFHNTSLNDLPRNPHLEGLQVFQAGIGPYIKGLVCLLLFLTYTWDAVSAQKIYSVDHEYQADLKVFVVDSEYKADLVVFKTNKVYRAKKEENKGIWYIIDKAYSADKKIFFVDKEYRADFKVFFTDKESRAGWRKNEKKPLLY